MKLYRFLLIATATLGLAFFSTSCGPNAQSSAVLGGLIGAGTGAFLGDKKDKQNTQQQQNNQNASRQKNRY